MEIAKRIVQILQPKRTSKGEKRAPLWAEEGKRPRLILNGSLACSRKGGPGSKKKARGNEPEGRICGGDERGRPRSTGKKEKKFLLRDRRTNQGYPIEDGTVIPLCGGGGGQVDFATNPTTREREGLQAEEEREKTNHILNRGGQVFPGAERGRDGRHWSKPKG